MTIGMPANETFEPVTIVNEEGSGPFVLVCDHASNFMPESYGHLGLSSEDLQAHISWDPGALGVSLQLSKLLDSPLVYSNVSRLIIDCNRETVAPDLIPCRSELTDIPGNVDLDADERTRRIALAHTPFHDTIDRLIDMRQSKGVSSALVSIHSYTPVYKGETRPWEIGLIYGDDASLAKPALELLKDRTPYTVGDNEPYSPADGVYYTLHRHGEARGLVPLMIEIRNDEIARPDAEAAWAATLAPILKDALAQAGGK